MQGYKCYTNQTNIQFMQKTVLKFDSYIVCDKIFLEWPLTNRGQLFYLVQKK
jgi:hypothetical protein